MKKFMCTLLTSVMVMGMAVNVGATQTITFDETGKGTVTTTVDGSSASSSSSSAITITDAQTQAPATDAASSSTSADDKSIDSVLKSLFGTDDTKTEDKKETKAEVKGYVSLGQDLTPQQLQTVLGLMGIDDISQYSVVYTTNAEEHAALDKYISPALIGTKSLSSVLVKPAEAGHGVVVTTNNINYCTTNMYRNALITAGVTDADITVVGPTQISGTAALIGALKAYEQMSGKTVSAVALDTSLNELVTTGEITNATGQDAQAEELISYIKAVVATNDLSTEAEIEAAVRKGMVDFNVTLSDAEVKQIVSLMLQIKAMGIDYSVLAEQADDIYAKYKDQINAGTFNINDVNLEDLGLKDIIAKAISNSVKSIGDGIKSFFGSLFK